MGRSGGGPSEATITGPFEVDALAYGTAATGGSALAAAIAAADLTKHTTIAFPTGSSLTWDTTPALPAGITGSLTVKFNDCLVTLTTSGIRLLDFHRTGNDQTFQNINVEGWLTVDAASLDGLAVGAATAVAAGNVTIGSGATANVVFGDVSTYRASGAIYVSSGANVGVTFAYTKVNATTLAVTNSTVGSVTFTVADGITGSNKNHVVLGTLVEAGTVSQARMSFDRITLKKIRTINVASSMTVAQTYRPNVYISEIGQKTDPYQSITNILVEDVDFTGGNTGVAVTSQTTPANVWIDQVTVRRWRHSTGLVPTANVSGAHVQVGGGGYGGTCWIEHGWGEYSADVGIETDSMTVANVSDVVCEDAYGGAFFWAQQNSPGQVTGTAGPTTTTLSGNGGSILASGNFNVAAALPDPSGVILIDNEIVTYFQLASSGTAVQGVQRGAYGTTAATHNDGATVTVMDLRPQVVQYTRCHARRTRISPAADFLCMGFYTYNNQNLRPGGAVRMRDCTYFRRRADYLTASGEALYVSGGVPSVEVDGFNVTIEGINHASGTTAGKAITFVQPSTFSSTTFPTPLSLKKVKVHASGTVQTADTFAAIYMDRGVWHLDWDDIYLSTQFPGIGASHTHTVDFSSNPFSYLSGKVKGLRIKSLKGGTPGGDLSPIGVLIPSTTFAVARGPLVFEGANFRDLQNSGSYTPFNVDSTNAAAVVVRDSAHATVPAPTGFTGLASGTGKALGSLWNANAVLTTATGTLITAVDYSTDGGTTYTNVLTQVAGALPAGANIVIPNLSSDALIKVTFAGGTQPTITLVPVNP